jgi:phosphonate transport system substrate-binding protein
MKALLLAIICALFLTACDQATPRSKMRIGYMNCNSEQETTARFGPLTAWLSQQLNIDFELVPVDTQEFAERFSAGEFEFTHSNSLLYVILKKEQQLQLLATEKRGRYGARTAGTIIARKDSGIRTFADLRGKRMIFGPQLAPSGYLAQYNLMLDAGIDPERDLAYYAIPHGSFKHEKVVYGVYFGEYDVAAAPALDLELMIRDGKIFADDFTVIGESPIFPYCTFGAAASVAPDLASRFKQALLTLTPETTVDFGGETIKVLGSAWIDGFDPLIDSDYDVLRELAKKANMPPYQEF